MKKILIATVLLLSVLLSFSGCANRPPKLEEIYDRVVELVEASYELNEIFYGEGLPYYDRTLPIYESLYSDYTKLGNVADYHIVSGRAKYHSIEEIKMAAKEVYSTSLLEESVFPGIFDGLVVSDAGSGSHYAAARYIEDNEDLYILMEKEDAYHPTPLVYDYATMKIIRPSNATEVLITMNAWEIDKPEIVFTMRLSLIQENGLWLLNKLTV